MHRSSVYEALGLLELGKRDLIRMLQLDPKIELRYLGEIKKLENKFKQEMPLKAIVLALNTLLMMKN